MVKKKLLYKYLLSYLLLFLIPLITLTISIYQNAISNLQKEVEVSNINKMKQIQDSIDIRMREIQQIATRISIDYKLSPFTVRSNEYNAKEAIMELGKYKASSAFFDEIFIYYRGDSRIYSSAGVNDIDTLTNRVYKYDNWNKEQFYEDINNLNMAKIRPAESISIFNDDTTKCLTFLYPLSSSGATPYGTLMFLVKESLLIDAINNVLGDFKSDVYIFSEEKKVIASHSSNNSITSGYLAGILNQCSNSGINYLRLNHDRYSLTSTKSSVTGWTFVIVMPTNQFLERVIHVKNLAILIVLLLIPLGLGSAIFFSMMNYKPINNLTKIIADHSKQASIDFADNELDAIQNTISSTFQHNRDLLSKIDSQEPLARSQFLIRLLRGHMDEKETIIQSLSSLHINLPGPKYYAMLIPIDELLATAASHSDINGLLKKLSKLQLHKDAVCVLDLMENNRMCIIMNLSQTEDLKTGQIDFAETIRSTFHHIFGVVPTIGIGNVCNDVLQLKRSFIEASAALEYKLKDGCGSILFFDDIKSLQDSMSKYPVEELSALVQSLKQGNTAVAHEAIDRVMESIRQQYNSMMMLRYICFDIINTVLKVMNEAKVDIHQSKLEKLLEFKSLHDLSSMLKDIFIDFCSHINKAKESNNIELRNAVLSYINENIGLYDLSLDKIAEAFNISDSYLSRFFKEQTGCNFSKYLWELRLKEVKKQLVTTNIPIKNIIHNIGYTDEANFIRKFREIEGITPGQYRQLYS